MSNFIKLIKKDGVLIKNNCLIKTFIRHGGAWNRDWKPGPYPKTQEEREAAAKKYGLHIRDYKPYPDDGTGWGDYPMFDPVAVESRDAFEHWDIHEFRRNYGDIMHPHFEVYTADRHDNKRQKLPYWKHVCMFLTVMSFMGVNMWYGETHATPRPHMRKQYPTEGKTHYTFEPAE